MDHPDSIKRRKLPNVHQERNAAEIKQSATTKVSSDIPTKKSWSRAKTWTNNTTPEIFHKINLTRLPFRLPSPLYPPLPTLPPPPPPKKKVRLSFPFLSKVALPPSTPDINCSENFLHPTESSKFGFGSGQYFSLLPWPGPEGITRTVTTKEEEEAIFYPCPRAECPEF